jgi:hypothetical protein
MFCPASSNSSKKRRSFGANTSVKRGIHPAS